MSNYTSMSCELEIGLLSALHIGTGFGLAGLVDDRITIGPVPHQSNLPALPYIPGASLKGRLRMYAADLAGPNSLALTDQAALRNDLFGTPTEPTRLVFPDAHLTDANVAAIRPAAPALTIEERTHVTISRTRRSAIDQLLMRLEVAAPGLQLTTTIRGWLPAERAERGLALLTLAACAITHLGGHKGRGLGAVHIRPTRVLLDGESCQLASLWEHL